MADLLPIIRRLHEGVYADVFVVQSPTGERACKISHEPRLAPRSTRPAFASTGIVFATGSLGSFHPDPNELLAREHEVLLRVKHPHVATVFDFGAHPTEADRSYLVTTYLDAPSWRTRLLAKAPPSIDEYMQFARTVATLHEEHAWMHGDLKPDNVVGDMRSAMMMIDPSAGMYRHDDKGALLTAFTTPSYNPFVIESDVPALASMLAELVCGTPLVPEGDDPSVPSIRERSAITLAASARAWCDDSRRVGQHRFVRRFLRMKLPRELRPEIPARLEDVILHGLGFAIRNNTVERVPAIVTPRAWCSQVDQALADA